jgi:hypothetical protein
MTSAAKHGRVADAREDVELCDHDLSADDSAGGFGCHTTTTI